MEQHPVVRTPLRLVQVFLSKNPSNPLVFTEPMMTLVGGGHTQRVPSNVFVDPFHETGLGSGLPFGEFGLHPQILVELGDHSSAPDIDRDGRFSASIDVNWHRENVWGRGTRDLQAVAGIAYSGQYQPG